MTSTSEIAEDTPPGVVEPDRPARSQREEGALAEQRERRKRTRPAPLLKAINGEDEKSQIVIDHPDKAIGVRLLQNALGCSSSEALQSVLDEMTRTFSSRDPKDLRGLNFAIQAIAAIAPRDELETMLALQMVATHGAAMRHIRSMNSAEMINQLEVFDRSANRLMRTFAAQLEALRKHRSGGQQKVEVRHVHVNDGGQAIIGSVATGQDRTSSGDHAPDGAERGAATP